MFSRRGGHSVLFLLSGLSLSAGEDDIIMRYDSQCTI